MRNLFLIIRLCFRLIVNQTLRLETPAPPQTVHQTMDPSHGARPLSQYLLSVSADGKLTLNPITIAAVEIQETPPASSSTAVTPCLTPIPSDQPDISSMPSPQLLLSTPVSFSEPRVFRPHDILPLPQVAQIGPRNVRPNKRLGSSRCLTSSPEMKRIREEFEEKQAKERRKLSKAS